MRTVLHFCSIHEEIDEACHAGAETARALNLFGGGGQNSCREPFCSRQCVVCVSVVEHLEKADLLGDQDFEIRNVGGVGALQRIV